MPAYARKIQAIRNLAAHPGTPAEGAVARAMLKKLTGEVIPPPATAEPPIRHRKKSVYKQTMVSFIPALIIVVIVAILAGASAACYTIAGVLFAEFLRRARMK